MDHGRGQKCSRLTWPVQVRTQPTHTYTPYLNLDQVAGLANAIATQLQGGVPLVVLDGLSPCFFKPYPQAIGCLFVLDARTTDANALSHNH